MSGDIVLGIRLTADGKGLVGEVRLSRAELDIFRKSADGVRDGAKSAGAGLDDMGRKSRDAARRVEEMDGMAVRAARSFTGWLAGIVTVTTALRTLRAAILAASEAEQSQRRLEAVLRATGQAAGLTAREINRLTEEMAAGTIFDDEAIRNASAVLLTFRNVQGETFREAMNLAAGLASVMQTDLQSAVFQVGRALDDPVEGMAALKRAGVNLSPVQEEQIRHFIRINDLASAQKIILGELNKKFGDAAKEMNTGITQATKGLGKAWNELLEALGRTPEMQTAVKGGVGWLSSELDGLRARLEKHGLVKGYLADLSQGLVTLYEALAGPRRGDRFGLGQALKGARNFLNAEPVNVGPSSANAEETESESAGVVDAQAAQREAARQRSRERWQAGAIAAEKWRREQALGIEQIEFETRALGQNELARRIATQGHQLDVEVTKRSWEATVEETAALRRAAEVLKGEYAAALTESYEATRTFEHGVRSAMETYRDETTNTARQVSGVLTNSFRRAEDAIVGAFTRGKFSADEFFRGLYEDLARMYVQREITGPLFGAIFGNGPGQGLVGGLGARFDAASKYDTNLFSEQTAMLAAQDALFASAHHTGGIVGEGRDTRVVPAHLFDGARRFHGGGLIGADEVPIIGKRGEEVLTASDPRHRANVGYGAPSISIVNHVDARGADPAAAQRMEAAMRETERRTLARVREELDRRGDLARATGRVR